MSLMQSTLDAWNNQLQNANYALSTNTLTYNAGGYYFGGVTGGGGGGNAIKCTSSNQYLLTNKKGKVMTGEKIIVVCGGYNDEAKDMDEAQRIAEKFAHQYQTEAFILKPVRKVAPKRDVVTTEITA